MKGEMFKNRIEDVMTSAMKNLRTLVDVDIVVGKQIETNSNLIIIPLTKVTMGFVSGGGEYNDLNAKRNSADFPMAGGTGGGFTVSPIGFFVLENNKFKLIRADKSSAYIGLIKNATDVMKKFLEKLKWEN